MFSISIQAGGQSTRMGSNKALIDFGGRPLIQRVYERVQPLSTDIFVTIKKSADFPAPGILVYEDISPGSGALSGLITAFHYAQNDIVAVIACDMPFIVPNLILAEFEFLLKLDVDVVIPRTHNGLEPMLAVYRISKCMGPANEALLAGKKRMISWFSSVKVHEIGVEVIQAFDPDLQSFINLNTPDEYRQALQFLKIFK